MRLITTGSAFSQALLECIERYDRMAFATAWASAGTKAFEAISGNRSKIDRGVIGTHFYQTDPKVLVDFAESHEVRFRLQPSGVFHPKVFLFWTGRQWEALVGSANLTKGAFGANAEVTAHITSEDADTAFKNKLSSTIRGFWRDAKSISPEEAATYKRQHKIMKAAANRLSGRYGGGQRGDGLEARGQLASMTWTAFVASVRREGKKTTRQRLALLDRVAAAFRSAGTFAELDLKDRTAIAGLPMKGEKPSGWFGSMGRASKFQSAVRIAPSRLSAALDCIPMEGLVTRDDFDRYFTKFAKAFPHGGGGIATSTRLLAMKRPDQFLCLDSANRNRLRQDLDLRTAAFDPARYWDEIIERMRDSPWWNAPRPRAGDERSIWAGRAALLDTIFYEAPDGD